MMKVFIDVGHGGNESGASNSEALEKDINLAVALKLFDKLKVIEGIETEISRSTDEYLSINQRTYKANTFGADIVISIHHNANNGKCSGYEVIHSVIGGLGKKLAGMIAEEFKAIGQSADSLGVWTRESEVNKGKDYYGIVRGCMAPTVITEFGYIDSNDFKKFDEEAEQEREAEAIFQAVLKFFNINDIYQILANNGFIVSPEYWIENAVPNGWCKGEFVHVVFERMAQHLIKYPVKAE